jgi:hypothetical protein
MEETNDSPLLAFLLGLIFIAFGILMYFGSSSDVSFGGLACAVTFGVLGGGFTVLGYVLSIRKQPLDVHRPDNAQRV